MNILRAKINPSQPAVSAQLRFANESDVDSIVAIHLQAFPGFFLSKLGPGFLRELYHGFVASESGICWVAEEDEQLVGFAIGSSSPAEFFKGLLKSRCLQFLRLSLGALVREPRLVGRKLLSAVTYRGEIPKLEGNGALLSSLAVAPESCSQGRGAALVYAFCETAETIGADYVYLTTDQEGNKKVNDFYGRLGFNVHAQFEKGGRPMNLYLRSCSQVLKQQAA